MAYDDFGGPYAVDSESRRLAYMLNGAADPHLAAAELSQDLAGLPPPAAGDLIARTRAYEDPSAGVQLTETRIPQTYLGTDMVITDGYGQPLDSGYRDVRVVGPGVDDRVAIVQSGGYSVFDQPQAVTGLSLGLILGRDLNWWGDHCDRDRDYWRGRQDWYRNYDGAHYGYRPNQTQINEYNYNNTTINNIYQQNRIITNNVTNIHRPEPVPGHGSQIFPVPRSTGPERRPEPVPGPGSQIFPWPPRSTGGERRPEPVAAPPVYHRPEMGAMPAQQHPAAIARPAMSAQPLHQEAGKESDHKKHP
jgi:hypothetical protein